MDHPASLRSLPRDSYRPTFPVQLMRALGEAVVFVLAFLTVWPFGSADPNWEAASAAGVAVLGFLWATHTFLTGRFHIALDGVTLALTALLFLSVVQIVPLPLGIVRVVSPSAARLHESLRPVRSEQLPGENSSVARSEVLPISIDPESTRRFAVRLAAMFIVYAAVRNWIATRAGLRRMAWAGMIVGAALSLLALGQFFSSPNNTIYWSVKTLGSVFGPFVSRTHYPDYVALCMGWTLAFLLTQKTAGNTSSGPYGSGPLDFLSKPLALAAVIALGLMSLSILFSLSRGGIISVIAAGLAVWFFLMKPRGGRINRAYLLFFLIGLGAAAYYFGIKPLESKIKSTSSTEEERIPLWRGTLAQVPGFFLFGSGNGTFPVVEPLARLQFDRPNLAYSNAHNEFIEALIEGGIVRFAITVGLVGVLLVGLGRGYHRRADRIVGPYILGIWFGIFALLIHSFTDYGIHITATGLLAAISAGFGMAATTDADFGATRQRKRKDSRTPDAPVTERTERAEPRSQPKPATELAFGGIAAIAVAIMLAISCLAIAIDTYTYYRAEDFLYAAKRMDRPSEPALIERKIELLHAAVALRPNESTYRMELGLAQLEAAVALSTLPFEAVAGPGVVSAASMGRLPNGAVEQYVLPALKELRTARDISPLYPVTQLLLGQFRQYFDHAEPRLAYLERAKILNHVDPNVWYACGIEEFAAGNDTAACNNWRRSLELSPLQIAPIIGTARKRLSAAEVQARILPDDPAILLRAAELYADQPAARKALLVQATDAESRPGWDARRRIAIAKAAESLGRYDVADAIWKAALEFAPEDYNVHDGATEFYEREERYDEALTHLNWMIRKTPGNNSLRDRALAARHGIDLRDKLKD